MLNDRVPGLGDPMTDTLTILWKRLQVVEKALKGISRVAEPRRDFASLFTDTPQSIGTAAYTNIVFDFADPETVHYGLITIEDGGTFDMIHSGAIPADYVLTIEAYVEWADNATGDRRMRIRGSDGFDHIIAMTKDSTGLSRCAFTLVRKLTGASALYHYLQVYQSSGAGLNLNKTWLKAWRSR